MRLNEKMVQDLNANIIGIIDRSYTCMNEGNKCFEFVLNKKAFMMYSINNEYFLTELKLEGSFFNEVDILDSVTIEEVKAYLNNGGIEMINKLQEMKKNLNGFELYVIEDVLENDNPIDYLRDILNGGCASGIVSALIYYTDTTKIYNDYEFEILEILEYREYFTKDNHENIVDNLKNGMEQIKNHMVWSAFGSVCYDIMCQLDENY